MWRVAPILGWRWRQPPLIRWIEAFALFGIALAIRFWLGPLLGVIPFVSFYPAILIAALLLGWKEAILSLYCRCWRAGISFCLPVSLYCQSVGQSQEV